jgi:hypothetical protein
MYEKLARMFHTSAFILVSDLRLDAAGSGEASKAKHEQSQ